MKKIVCLVLMAIMIFSLCACGAESNINKADNVNGDSATGSPESQMEDEDQQETTNSSDSGSAPNDENGNNEDESGGQTDDNTAYINGNVDFQISYCNMNLPIYFQRVYIKEFCTSLNSWNEILSKTDGCLIDAPTYNEEYFQNHSIIIYMGNVGSSGVKLVNLEVYVDNSSSGKNVAMVEFGLETGILSAIARVGIIVEVEKKDFISVEQVIFATRINSYFKIETADVGFYNGDAS